MGEIRTDRVRRALHAQLSKRTPREQARTARKQAEAARRVLMRPLPARRNLTQP
ncbi:MAG: hypothetical protein QOE06_3529 [Thermoleophilaceae bacterium]|jgi:hypothetical protein|nr:hypothetical protein [Thermoleophilaceae bacterium]